MRASRIRYRNAKRAVLNATELRDADKRYLKYTGACLEALAWIAVNEFKTLADAFARTQYLMRNGHDQDGQKHGWAEWLCDRMREDNLVDDTVEVCEDDIRAGMRKYARRSRK